MNAAANPAVQAVADTQYFKSCIESELQLAPLLRWGDLSNPTEFNWNTAIMGNNCGARGLDIRLSRTFLPRWRRLWDAAGALIGSLRISLLQTQGAVTAYCDMHSHKESFTDHPEPDYAMRAAVVAVAIAVLTERREQADAVTRSAVKPGKGKRTD